MKTTAKNLIITSLLVLGFLTFSHQAHAATVTKTLYAWARDLVGNISAYLSDSVDITISSSATTYYVSYTDGNDSNNGTSSSTPWKTISKVNTTSLSPGDSVLFKKGDTWTLGPSEYLYSGFNGTAGSPITFGAYGSGSDPVFTSFATLTGWSSEGNGIYSKQVAIQSNADVETYVVTVDGVNTPRGRYPDSGWLTYESTGSTEVSITDDQLASSPSWTGAEAVIRKSYNAWMLDRNVITNHSGTKLVYFPGSNWFPLVGFGYFIQDDIKTLTLFGEWYYDTSTSKLYMYFGSNNPTNHTIKIATGNYGIMNYYNSYQTFDHLNLIGFNNYGYLNRGSSHIIFQNSKVELIGLEGLFVWPWDGGASYLTFDNNTITNTGGGIGIKGTGTNMTIINNNINNTGLILGNCALYTDDNWGDGIALFHDNSLVEYNNLTNIGHSGIRMHAGDNIIIKHNYVNGFGLSRYDAGGIYAWNDGNYDPDYQKIQDNIVLNGNSVSSGVAGRIGADLAVWGIYLDLYDTDSNIEVNGNTSSNSPTGGMLVYLSTNAHIHDNTFYNNGYQIQFSNMGSPYITGSEVNDNIFFAKQASQYAFGFDSLENNFSTFGTADNNYFVRPIDDNLTVQTKIGYGSSSYTNLAGWRTLSGQDANSHTSPISTASVNNIRFEYNETNSNKTVSLGSDSYMDVTGMTYTGNITLTPYTSIVLIKV